MKRYYLTSQYPDRACRCFHKCWFCRKPLRNLIELQFDQPPCSLEHLPLLWPYQWLHLLIQGSMNMKRRKWIEKITDTENICLLDCFAGKKQSLYWTIYNDIHGDQHWIHYRLLTAFASGAPFVFSRRKLAPSYGSQQISGEHLFPRK